MSDKMASCKGEELAEKVNQSYMINLIAYLIQGNDIKSNAWQKVADDLEFENGEC